MAVRLGPSLAEDLPDLQMVAPLVPSSAEVRPGPEEIPCPDLALVPFLFPGRAVVPATLPQPEVGYPA